MKFLIFVFKQRFLTLRVFFYYYFPIALSGRNSIIEPKAKLKIRYNVKIVKIADHIFEISKLGFFDIIFSLV